MLILNGIWKNSFQIEASQLSGMGLWKVKKLYNLQSLSMKIQFEKWIEWLYPLMFVPARILSSVNCACGEFNLKFAKFSYI